MPDGLQEGVGHRGEDGKRPNDFSGFGICPFVPNPRHGKRPDTIAWIDEVGLGEFLLLGTFDHSIGENQAPPVADGLAKHGFLNDAHGTRVARIVLFVVVSFGSGIDHIKLLLGPARCKAELLHLKRLRSIAGNDRSLFSVRNVGIGAPSGGDFGSRLHVEAFFDGLNRRDGDVATTHDAMNLLMTVGKKQGRFSIKRIGTADGTRFKARGSDNAAVAILVANAV